MIFSKSQNTNKSIYLFIMTTKYLSSFAEKWLIPFSGLSNMEKLGSPNDQEEFSVIHALKAITMCQIIVGHRNMNVLGNVMFNPEFTEEVSNEIKENVLNILLRTACRCNSIYSIKTRKVIPIIIN